MEICTSLGLGQQLCQKLSLAQSLELTQAQRLQIQGHILSIRMDLIQELRGERYKPKADCPRCSRRLTPIEIIQGFNQDPSDFTTCCSACGHRFEPLLVCFSNEMEIKLPFYCDCQTLAQLRGKETIPPELFAREYPAIYRSAIVHHGGIRKAFEKIGIRYEFEEISDWKAKIHPFLGRLPDTIIAGCVNMSASTIRKVRQKMGITKYTLSKMLEETGIEA